MPATLTRGVEDHADATTGPRGDGPFREVGHRATAGRAGIGDQEGHATVVGEGKIVADALAGGYGAEIVSIRGGGEPCYVEGIDRPTGGSRYGEADNVRNRTSLPPGLLGHRLFGAATQEITKQQERDKFHNLGPSNGKDTQWAIGHRPPPPSKNPAPPLRVYLIGFMGSGKSHTATRLATRLGLPALDLDDLVEDRLGCTIAEAFRERGERYFRGVERQALEEVAALPAFVLATGGGTPCYADGIELMNRTGSTVFLDVALPLLLQRLETGRAHRPLLASATDLSQEIARKLAERRGCYERAQHHLMIDDPNLEVARLIAERLEPA